MLIQIYNVFSTSPLLFHVSYYLLLPISISYSMKKYDVDHSLEMISTMMQVKHQNSKQQCEYCSPIKKIHATLKLHSKTHDKPSFEVYFEPSIECLFY